MTAALAADPAKRKAAAATRPTHPPPKKAKGKGKKPEAPPSRTLLDFL